MTIKPKQNLVSKNKYNIKCPYPMNAEYITIHNTYNDAPAENEIKYMIGNNNEVSFHYAIDDKEVVQGIPIDRNAWHCGDGLKGKGNRSSIGIEISYSKSGGERYRRAEALTVKFVAQLLKERNWGIDKVKKHQDWSNKYCPHRILGEDRWNAFLKAIETELKPKQEEVNMELKDWQYKDLQAAYQNAYDRNILKSNKWVGKARKKEITLDEAIFLNTVIVDRALK